MQRLALTPQPRVAGLVLEVAVGHVGVVDEHDLTHVCILDFATRSTASQRGDRAEAHRLVDMEQVPADAFLRIANAGAVEQREDVDVLAWGDPVLLHTNSLSERTTTGSILIPELTIR